MGKRKCADAALDMTPMIDVVFQLIIFFVVTVKMDSDYNKDIKLENGKHGPIIKEMSPLTMIVEVNKRGVISMHKAIFDKKRFGDFCRSKYNKYGPFPVLIRADKKTRHKDVKAVMDILTANGVWKIQFVAIQEKKVKD